MIAERIRVKTVRAPGGQGEATEERKGAADILITVRSFYLDLSQWALEDPGRWGPWAVPCPIRAGDVQYRKMASLRKARMDQRTRERLPAMPALAAAVARNRQDAAARLDAARAARPGELFTAGGQTLRRAEVRRLSPRTWAEDPQTGRRRDLTREEDNAFWAWAAVEVLRMTGIRVEEVTELSHHSLIQYRLPSAGELIPLLSVAPSKTDEERLLVIAPELADALSAVICRIRDPDGSVPLAVAYDHHEKTWNPPMPLLFQRRVGLENRPIPISGIRDLLAGALAAAGITGTDGKPLDFAPHDFRRIFATEAIMNGMPPHIAQLILGHRDINTTMGYKAVYPEEAINGHRAFITRRRALRPSEEYRTPTDEEWEEFLGHFERRKLALGDCGRAYGSSCIHEHSCVRCPLLRIDPAQRHRLQEIHDSLTARITEAEREGWTGEAEGLKVSLAAAEAKLAQADGLIARRTTATDLGIPAYRDIAAGTHQSPDPARVRETASEQRTLMIIFSSEKVPEPGMWLQWDWGDGPLIGGRKTQLFCAWLAWSRFRVVIPVWDQQLGTLTWCLDQALRAVGGAPTYLLADNARTVTMDHVAGIPVRHPEMVALGRHYGCKVETCVPFDPESKGGVEATVKIAKADLVPSGANLLPAYRSFTELQEACQAFCERVNARVHRETAAAPAARLAAEREMLHPLPAEPYALALGEERLVGDDQTVRFGPVRYSTPPGHAGTRVWCRVAGTELVITARTGRGAAETARHRLSVPGSPQILDGHYPHHPGGNGPRQPRPRPRTEAEAAFLAIGDGAQRWLAEAAACGTARIRSKMARAVELAAVVGAVRVDAALGLAAIAGRLAGGDLASIIDHLAAEREIGEVVRAGEAHSVQPGTSGWARLGTREAGR